MYWANGDRREDGGFLWQVPVDKSDPPRQITFDEAPADGDDDRPNQDSDPVFSPDGGRIAFRRTAPDGVATSGSPTPTGPTLNRSRH